MNTQKGFAPILLILLGLAVIGSGVYFYTNPLYKNTESMVKDEGANSTSTIQANFEKIKINFNSSDERIELGKDFTFYLELNQSEFEDYKEKKIFFYLDVPICRDSYDDSGKLVTKFSVEEAKEGPLKNNKTEKILLLSVQPYDKDSYVTAIKDSDIWSGQFRRTDCFKTKENIVPEVYPVRILAIDSQEGVPKSIEESILWSSKPFTVFESRDSIIAKEEKYKKHLKDLFEQSIQLSNELKKIGYVEYGDEETRLSFSYPDFFGGKLEDNILVTQQGENQYSLGKTFGNTNYNEEGANASFSLSLTKENWNTFIQEKTGGKIMFDYYYDEIKKEMMRCGDNDCEIFNEKDGLVKLDDNAFYFGSGCGDGGGIGEYCANFTIVNLKEKKVINIQWETSNSLAYLTEKYKDNIELNKIYLEIEKKMRDVIKNFIISIKFRQ